MGLVDILSGNVIGELKENIKSLLELFVSDFIESAHYRITQEDFDYAEGIEGFKEITSVPYDGVDIDAYYRALYQEIIEKAELARLKKTACFNAIFSEKIESCSLDGIMSSSEYTATKEKMMSKDAHKRAVLDCAARMCLYKKNVTFKTAIKQVIKKENEGVPAYRQKVIYESERKEKFYSEIKKRVDFVEEHDLEILLNMILN